MAASSNESTFDVLSFTCSCFISFQQLLTPIRNNGRLTRAQKAYNYRLCRCRARIEHCFGKLFSQWRRLKFLESYNFECAVKTIVACFVLHNFMILEGHEVHVRFYDVV